MLRYDQAQEKSCLLYIFNVNMCCVVCGKAKTRYKRCLRPTLLLINILNTVADVYNLLPTSRGLWWWIITQPEQQKDISDRSQVQRVHCLLPLIILRAQLRHFRVHPSLGWCHCIVLQLIRRRSGGAVNTVDSRRVGLYSGAGGLRACRGGQGVSEGTLLLFGPTQGDAGGPWWAEYQHDLCPDQSLLLLLLLSCQSSA